MNSYITQYGELKSISIFNEYSENVLKECVLNERISINTPLGVLIPQYEYTGVRRKQSFSVAFYKSGMLSKIALHDQTVVESPIGKLPAELISFYESGKIKRLFPLNGKLSGYWEEENEYELAPVLDLNFPFGNYRIKIISINFYENGLIKSVTLWPQDILNIKTPIGVMKVRNGLSLYENGNIKSFEPAIPIQVNTPIGSINAFDKSAVGISGDTNSVNFNEASELISLVTSSNKVIVTNSDNIKNIHSPIQLQEVEDNDLYFNPLKIDFGTDEVSFNGMSSYKISQNTFKIGAYNMRVNSRCSDCSSCTKCS